MTPREAYEQWLKDFADDRETVDELLATLQKLMK